MPRQGWTLEVADTEADIASVDVGGRVVTLTLEDDETVEHAEVVTVAYQPPSAGVIEDLAGNDAAAIAEDALTVTNNVPDPNDTTAPVPVSASVARSGRSVSITFSEDIQLSGYPPGQPRAPEVVNAGSTTITIQWMASRIIENQAGAATYYEWRRRTSASGGTAAGTWTDWARVTATSVNLTGLTADTAYDFEIRAGNAEGMSRAQAFSGSTTPVLPAGPMFSASTFTSTVLVVMITEYVHMGVTAASYEIQSYDSSDSTWKVLGANHPNFNTSTMRWIGLNNFVVAANVLSGSVYPPSEGRIRVRAYNSGGMIMSQYRELTLASRSN